MIRLPEVGERERASVLGRASPLVKLGLALGWLVALVTTVDPRPGLLLAAIATSATVGLGAVAPGQLLARLAPLWSAALAIGLLNALLSTSNVDPGASELVRLGPLRVTEPGVADGVAIALRIVAIAAVGVLVGSTTDPTRLVDALAQQARVPDRFAYGALAAYQAVPRLADDLRALQQARRIRGLRAAWSPGLLFGLLVLAIRHADRLALAMDARAFGSGPRSSFRVERWSLVDGLVLAAGLAVLAGVIVVGRL